MHGTSQSAFEGYLRKINLRVLIESLEISEVEPLVGMIRHFTVEEAEKRDQIVLSYFGENGVKRIADAIIGRVLAAPKPRQNATILDVGAGSGFFTLRVVGGLRQHLPNASFYAMDITPAMLRALARKTSELTLFLGVGENIAGSVELARSYLRVPEKFDVVFSTLVLHHCLEVEKVFKSIAYVLRESGRAVIVDLCEHAFKEFREEMGDVHLGFSPTLIEEMARGSFSNVHVERMPGILCTCSGRSAELFIATMMRPKSRNSDVRTKKVVNTGA